MRIPLALFLLAGCAPVPPASMQALSGVDVLSVSSADLAVAVDLTAPLAIEPGSATLFLGATGKDGISTGGTFILARRAAASEGRDGANRHVYRISAADLAAFDALRAEISEMKAADPDAVDGRVSVQARPCRTGPVPADKPLQMSTAIRLAADGPFLPLLQNLDLRQAAGTMETALPDVIPPCTSGSPAISRL